jgi:hypothetical protein
VDNHELLAVDRLATHEHLDGERVLSLLVARSVNRKPPSALVTSCLRKAPSSELSMTVTPPADGIASPIETRPLTSIEVRAVVACGRSTVR